MIQDIGSERLDNSFRAETPAPDSTVFVFSQNALLCRYDAAEGTLRLPVCREADKQSALTYLFLIGEQTYFLAEQEIALPGWELHTIQDVRRFQVADQRTMFAVFTAFHLWKWYASNRFCGACGHPVQHSTKERALCCPDCGNVIYPRINPAVIIGVTSGDRLLITRYRRGYAHNALVAGFTEIGETAEQTVEREVMEEAGIRVKNIRYYKSQPWGVASDLLLGFFCEADGDDTIRMDENELKYAAWLRPEEIELQPNQYSLTNEMMRLFKEGKMPGQKGE
jgi:NAD+ diphosphatase